ncbi:MAG: hypothetical protein DWQ02_02830, partial [Bacteroidetes bacterium]
MKKILTILLLFSTISPAFAQTIEELEYDLSRYDSYEDFGKKIDKARMLQQLDPFNLQAIDYICEYYIWQGKDSISIFFDNLIIEHPGKVEPYLLRTRLLHHEHDWHQRDKHNKLTVRYLEKAFAIDSTDSRVLFHLAKTYYRDFIYPLEKQPEYPWVDTATINSLFPEKKDE